MGDVSGSGGCTIEPKVGSLFGPYELLEEIGRGGMATVYRASQASVGRFVALKVLHTSLTGRREALARFLREARLIARLEHPNILPVYDFDGTHDPPYLVMRYLDGATLKQVLASELPRLAEAARWLGQIAVALDYAHRQQVVHRDIKPSNILIDREGNAFLADFGIARLAHASSADSESTLTETGSLVGTPAYMAPEQSLGEATGTSSDLYSLGVVLFEMVTGKLPFLGDHPLATVLRHVNEPAPSILDHRPDHSQALDRVVQAALAKNPSDRYATASELVDAVFDTLQDDLDVTKSSRALIHRVAPPSGAATGADPGLAEALRLAAVDSPTPNHSSSSTIETHRQVTVLYANFSECVALHDATENEDRLLDIRRALELAISHAGGNLHQRSRDHLMAIWGLESVTEADAENAIRAALAMQRSMRGLLDENEDSGEPLPMQIGIATGPVLVAVGGSDSHPSARGVTTSLVKRLERATPAGSVLITHETYRQVRGVFSFEAGDPLRIRGMRSPLQTYRVKRAKPRAFKRQSRGVEGVETRLVGRQAEFHLLQEVFWAAVEEKEAQLVVLVGDPGVGKSRLLYELTDWSDLSEVAVWLFQGRAMPETQAQPYGLLRNILAFRFEIHDDDAPEIVQKKLEQGTESLLGHHGPAARETAHYIGRLTGFELADCCFSEDLETDAERFRERALHHLVRLIRGACVRYPMMIQLEDLQWADDSSFDALTHVLRQSQDLPLVIVALGRPEIDDRRPHWGRDLPSYTRIDLRPLSRRESRALVREILQRVPDVPAALRDLIVDRSEGNPFFLEELIRVLLEEHVILKGHDEWRIEVDRIPEMPVPSTLTGLVQVRLDSLFPAERLVLQRAAVIGRVFWDDAVVALQTADGIPIEVSDTLEALSKRDLVRSADGSTFGDFREFVFPSTLVRDVVIDTLPSALRRSYHAAAAQWLQQVSGGRAHQFGAQVADHLELSGDADNAIPYLFQAGERAIAVSAFREAESLLLRALQLVHPKNEMVEMLLIRLGECLHRLGRFSEAERKLEAALRSARAGSKLALQAEALSRLARVNVDSGRLKKAKRLYRESLELAEKREDLVTQARALYGLGDLAWRQEDLAEAESRIAAGLDLARKSGRVALELYCLNRLGSVAMFRQDEGVATRYYEQCRDLAERSGHRDRQAAALGNLGVLQRLRGDLEGAEGRFREVMQIAESIGDPLMSHVTQLNLGVTLARQGQSPEARELFSRALRFARDERLATLALGALVGEAGLLQEAGDIDAASSLLGVVLGHKNLDADVRFEASLVEQRLATPRRLEAEAPAKPLWDIVEEVLAGTA